MLPWMIRPKLSKSDDGPLDGKASQQPTNAERLSAALFYGGTSMAVIFTNKYIMTGYAFPYFDFLAFIQFLATTVILTVLVLFRYVEIPTLNFSIFCEIFPVSLMFLGNVICGLGSTRSLNLPMFTALRRFSIFMTMSAEYFVLSHHPPPQVVVSVLMMVGGAFFAALFDLTFDAYGYSLVFMNNVFTALNGVYLKKASVSGKCNKMGILYYNSLFSAIIMLMFYAAEHAHMTNSGVDIVNGKATKFQGLESKLIARPKFVVNNVNNNNPIASAAVSSSLASTVGKDRNASPNTTSSTLNKQTIGVTTHRQRSLLRRALLTLQLNTTIASSSVGMNNVIGHSSSTRSDSHGSSIDGSSDRHITSIRRGGGSSNSIVSSSNAVGTTSQVPPTVSSSRKAVYPPSTQSESTLTKIYKHEGWLQWDFLLFFSSAAVMGSVLNYSIFVCTTVNSALTTAVVGCLKNVATTYVGMVMFPDYAFNWPNFVGINISIAGSLYYTYMTLFKGMQGFGGG